MKSKPVYIPQMAPVVPAGVHWSRDLSKLRSPNAPVYVGDVARAARFMFFRHYWPLVLIVSVFATGVWTAQKCVRLEAQAGQLKAANASLVEVAMRQAGEAFDAGDFHKAEVLLKPVQLSLPSDPNMQLLRARILECNCRFEDAANAYQRLTFEFSDMYPKVKDDLLFCRRMCTERRVEFKPSRETLYRLHGELMRRFQAPQARVIALGLLPDIEPLRASTEASLRTADSNAMIMPYRDGTRMNVKVNKLDQQVLAQFDKLPIHLLSAQDSGVDLLGIFSGLDIQALDLSHNQFSDVSPLRTMPGLASLDISYCPVADIRALAGLPLVSLNLAHTHVSSLQYLTLCPLETLSLAGLPVRDLSPLRLIALHELDLSYTRVTDISAVERMPLSSLRLDGTKVHDLKPLEGMKLKILSLKTTPVSDLTPLAGMPLTKLDLRGCTQITDLSPLASCTQLEELRLPKGIPAPAFVMHLPKLKIISH